MLDPMNREYPALRMISSQIDIKADTSVFNFPLKTELKDVEIIGAFILIPDAGAKRRTSKGKVLCNENAIKSGFVTIKSLGKDQIQTCPLEFLVFNPESDRIGTYAQLFIPKDWDQEQSVVSFKTSGDLVVGEQLEFFFLTVPKGTCML